MSVLRASQSWEGKGHQKVLIVHQDREPGEMGLRCMSRSLAVPGYLLPTHFIWPVVWKSAQSLELGWSPERPSTRSTHLVGMC